MRARSMLPAMKSFWDERYAEDGFAYGDRPNDFLAEVKDRLPRGPVLCLAEGEGRNAVHLLGLGPVTAMDQSAVGLQKAEALARTRGGVLRTVAADLATFELGGPWSVITSIWAHVPPAIRRRVHAAVPEALAPGGALVLEAYTPAQVGRGTGGPPDPALTMTLEGLREELPGLDFVIGRELEREVHEGKYHEGLSSVVQVLAFRR